MRRWQTPVAAAILGLLAAVSLSAQPSQQFADDPPGILLLSVDALTTPYIRLIADSFVQVTLAAPQPPAVYVESLDSSRFAGPEHLEGVRDWLRRKYAGRRIDLVVPLGILAVEFLAKEKGEPWPDAHVMYAEPTRVRTELLSQLRSVSGVRFEEPFPASVEVVARILPQTRRVVLATGDSAFDRGRLIVYRDAARLVNPAIEFTFWAGKSIEDLVAEASSLPPGTVLFFTGAMIDANGRALAPSQVCGLLAPSASVPLFSLVAQDVGCGVVGGQTWNWPQVGQIIGRNALAQLAAPKGGEVEVPLDAATSLTFDARQLRRWNIPERQLPEGSTVLFREPNLWRDRRALVITTIGVTLAQALLIAGLVAERKRRRRAELEGRRNLAAMAHLDRQAAMGALATSLAHELNQPLNAILQNAGAAQMMLTSGTEPPPIGEVLEILDDIQKDDARAGEVIRGMREMLQNRDLDTTTLDVNALARETTAFVLTDAASRGIRVDLQLADGLSPVRGVRIHLQQVLLNLLLNSMDAVADLPPDRRHVCVRTSQRDGQVDVLVVDRGVGIPPHALPQIFEAFYTTKGTGMGMGLSISRSILEAHGGQMHAANNADGGATVGFSLPADVPS